MECGSLLSRACEGFYYVDKGADAIGQFFVSASLFFLARILYSGIQSWRYNQQIIVVGLQLKINLSS